ncbi:MAG: 2-oxo-4-hydroxy-4-carboxy-5-ureidoimidazoline decarboxylase [Pseudomonadota bacterium]|nr:2-oxo-4-hydroxy-4-carboxy-5-ureidoimidazoline decarboxylase [Pseudomonadota bacterium]
MTTNAASLSTVLAAPTQQDFVQALAGIFEHSAWVAEAAWVQRPFASVEHLLQALLQAMWQASPEQQLALIRAHPELAGKLAIQGELTVESTREQAGAGLQHCTPEQFAQIQQLNTDYQAKFGWPFIIAVKGLQREQIIQAMQQRLQHQAADEFNIALTQISKIAQFRLYERFGLSAHLPQPVTA